MLNNLPLELRALPQWVCADDNKLPINPHNGQRASVTDPTSWGTFDQAIRAGCKRVGFVLTLEAGYSIIDLDNKPDKPATQEQLERHQQILAAFDSYTERSTSGRGFHIIVKGTLPSGVHRDNVEIYSTGRYMICTGDVVRNSPIADYQPLLDQMYGQMRPTAATRLLDTDDGPIEEIHHRDRDLIETAMRASNGDKYTALCNGDQTGYPSQSEADFALLSMIAFYTQSNAQVRRLFRATALGKREKAIKNDTYLDFALGKIRAQQPPPIDPGALIANADALIAKAVKMPEQHESLPGISLPPGLVGELAQYFYHSAIRPVPEIALAAAIAITAGVCGRSYNISGAGLNQYIIILARTGSGKEGALSGIERVITAARPTVPMVDQFMGPAAFASGQALVRVLNDRPCFVSVLGEFGLTLQQLSDARANGPQLMLRKVLLDLYSKSGWQRTLQSSVYSDVEKNTATIQSPCVTILGEATPESFFDGLAANHIAEGLIPRFSIVEYTGERPPRNKNANLPPNVGLTQKFVDLVTISLTTANNNTCAQVQMDTASHALLDSFDARADAVINAAKAEVDVQLWNRAHLKALKLAALLAVGINPHRPVVTADLAQWAIDFTEREIRAIAKRFATGDVGQGDSKQYVDLKRTVEGYFVAKGRSLEQFAKLHRSRIIPYAWLSRKTANLASFRLDRLGATQALKRTLQDMIDSGMLVEVARTTLAEKYEFSGVAYAIGRSWI